MAHPDRGRAPRGGLRGPVHPRGRGRRDERAQDGRRPRDACRVHGLAYEDVTFSTADGVALSGWYVPSRNGAAVVLLHGAGSTRSAVLPHTVVLADDGFGVLLYDARGHGRSQGPSHGLRLVRRPGRGGRRRLRGRSGRRGSRDGSPCSGCRWAARRRSARRRPTLASERSWPRGRPRGWPATRPGCPTCTGVRGWVQEQLDRAMYATADGLTAASPPIRLQRFGCARGSPRPDLAHHRRGCARRGARRRAHPGRLTGHRAGLDRTGAGHTRSLAMHPAEWEDRVVSFLAHALGLP